MGVSLTEDFTEITLDTPFYGVYRGQSALPMESDKLAYLTNSVLEGCRVYDYESGEYLPVYTLDKAGGSDPYEIFLSGPKSLLRIENPNAKTERKLIVFRDSFGASLIPLLAEGYREITLIDIRYLSPASLGRFVDFDAQDSAVSLQHKRAERQRDHQISAKGAVRADCGAHGPFSASAAGDIFLSAEKQSTRPCFFSMGGFRLTIAQRYLACKAKLPRFCHFVHPAHFTVVKRGKS